MNEWKEIAVAWGIAAALLFVGIQAAHVASGQPRISAAPVAVRFAEALPIAPAHLPYLDEDFR